MHEQLHLLRSDDQSWKLDDDTREIGRRGLEEARAALRRATTVERPALFGRRAAAARVSSDRRLLRSTAA